MLRRGARTRSRLASHTQPEPIAAAFWTLTSVLTCLHSQHRATKARTYKPVSEISAVTGNGAHHAAPLPTPGLGRGGLFGIRALRYMCAI